MNMTAARRLLTSLVMLLALALTGCAAPKTDSDQTAADATAPRTEAAGQPITAAPAVPSPKPDAMPPRNKPAPPMSDPLPPERVPDAKPAPGRTSGGKPLQVDTSCKTAADCTVKNVGNCCGYYPACVNVNSATDPAGVQAQCAKDGMASVCGFPEISACQCVQGTCQAGGGAVAY